MAITISVTAQTTRDSIGDPYKVTIAAHDSCIRIPEYSYWKTDTFKVPVITDQHYFGVYHHPSYVNIGSSTSENKFLQYLKDKVSNMFNLYDRADLTTSTGRKEVANFLPERQG